MIVNISFPTSSDDANDSSDDCSDYYSSDVEEPEEEAGFSVESGQSHVSISDIDTCDSDSDSEDQDMNASNSVSTQRIDDVIPTVKRSYTFKTRKPNPRQTSAMRRSWKKFTDCLS